MIIFITGGNRGLGKETAKQLASKNHTIIISARNEEKGLKALKELKTATRNNDIHFVKMDVTNSEDINHAYQWINHQFGALDVLINNAAIILNGSSTTNVSISDLRQTFDTNFFAPFQISQTFLPLLKKSKDARIINVSSGMGAFDGIGGGWSRAA